MLPSLFISKAGRACATEKKARERSCADVSVLFSLFPFLYPFVPRNRISVLSVDDKAGREREVACRPNWNITSTKRERERNGRIHHTIYVVRWLFRKKKKKKKEEMGLRCVFTLSYASVDLKGYRLPAAEDSKGNSLLGMKWSLASWIFFQGVDVYMPVLTNDHEECLL